MTETKERAKAAVSGTRGLPGVKGYAMQNYEN
jgi:hypothetical protein